ncbi:MAG: baseplate assembly protein [Sphingomonas sp.]|jgi:phage-related baseplate assembly protein|nr:baseplate assembly protein [Sphingomonas sp.]
MAGIMAASSSTVDLSRLAAPTIVEQRTFEQILTDMIAAVQQLMPAFDATIDSDPAVKVLQVAAYREFLIRGAFQDGALQLLVAYATGLALDHLGALVGVARLTIAPADPAPGRPAVMEADEAFRQRIVLAPESFSSAGPELAYVAHAKGASAEVLDATASSPAPGVVRVSILSTQGDGTASAQLVDAVDAVVNSPAIRPLGDAVTTTSATIRNFEIRAVLITYSGPDISIVLDEARRALAGFNAENRKLGRSITRSGIIAALSVAGVHRVDLASPAADVICDATEAAWPIAIDVSHGGYAA